jgi:phosphoserine phosphatase
MAQQCGHYTVILSSSPDFLIKPIADKLRVDAWESTSYAVDKDHRFCDISRLMQGADKAVILEEIRQQHGVAPQNVIAYSDSHLDLPFLQAAGRAVAVNPNRKLKAACRLHGWKVI